MDIKKIYLQKSILLILVLTIGLFKISYSSNNRAKKSIFTYKLRAEYQGTWSAPTSEVTVRTEPEKCHFVFTKGSADFSMNIHADKTASGHIGHAKFENARIEKKAAKTKPKFRLELIRSSFGACSECSSIIPNGISLKNQSISFTVERIA